MPTRAYYDRTIPEFLLEDPNRILGTLTVAHHHALEEPQRWAWLEEIRILKTALASFDRGRIFLEFYIPRMGKRADAALLINGVVYVFEFKIGSGEHSSDAIVQVEDYALDLKNFHEGSHLVPILPVLIATDAPSRLLADITFGEDGVSEPIRVNSLQLKALLQSAESQFRFSPIDVDDWLAKGYRPTPTIVEAAQVLYRTHSVTDISRYDAGAINLQATSDAVSAIIDASRRNGTKAICFVTGVPGSGKTLAGLNVATRRAEEHLDENAVFLSGNGPLVDVLREALSRDLVKREHVKKTMAERRVRSFVQNIHHFRDEYVGNNETPAEVVVVFDEAQRAWSRAQASKFMQRKRGQMNFNMSEPEFLVGVMDRHRAWCVIVCLVGGGQEINTGEAGILEWLDALQSQYPHWEVHLSPRVSLPEYSAGRDLTDFLAQDRVFLDERLHLSVTMRSYRAEAVSDFVADVLDNNLDAAQTTCKTISSRYPVYLTRDLNTARSWLRFKARGSERFGLVASSGAQRLRPEGIYIKAQVDPPTWFLNGRNDVRSSFYLEEVASEFDVQGLELDWVGVCWDGDLWHNGESWIYQNFKGTKWNSVRDHARKVYLKNAYRVLLTRARQGMVIFVPNGDLGDPTRPPHFYDGIYNFLLACGIEELK